MTRVGDARRAAVVERAVDVASVYGFEGLSFGGLAEATGVNKSALQVLFGTKETLQLSVLAEATRVWRTKVLQPAEQHPDGLAQVRALLDGWIDYLPLSAGGCPFIAAASEMDGRPGSVREAVADAARRGLQLIRRQVALAIRLGELRSGTDADQLTFELHAVLLKANHDLQLFGDQSALDHARTALARVLDQAGS